MEISGKLSGSLSNRLPRIVSTETLQLKFVFRQGESASSFKTQKVSKQKHPIKITFNESVSFSPRNLIDRKRRPRGNLNVNAVSDSESEVVTRLDRKEFQFVHWFREAWPYIQGHRGSTFVLVFPGEVVADKQRLDSMLQDVALMHGLGVKLVLVPGTHVQIDELLRERGIEPRFHGAYRVTDSETLEAAMEASGRIRVHVEARLSRGPSIPALRRHGETDKWHSVGISVASGNFVFAKRRGVVDGVDFGNTGEVKKVDVERIRERLNSNCVVLLSNLGFTPTGEVLNCNTYEVGTAAATALQADKLVCMLDGPITDDHGRVLRWMTLQQADLLIRQRASQSTTAGDHVRALAGPDYAKALGLSPPSTSANGSATPGGRSTGEKAEDVEGEKGRAGEEEGEQEEGEEDVGASRARWEAQRALYSMDFELPPAYFAPIVGKSGVPVLGVGLVSDASVKTNGGSNGRLNRAEKEGSVGGFAVGGVERLSRTFGYLSELTAAVFSCRAGIRRVHLLDSGIPGSLLLELYTREGVGTMVSSDLYEGTRAAQLSDVPGISALLKPLEDAGVLVKRSQERLTRELPFFTVMEQDGHIISCAALFPFASHKSAEVAAFAVAPNQRGNGRGDSLLAYLEKRSLDLGIEKLFLLTTRTADWFEQRGFAPCELDKLPHERVIKIDRTRNSKAFMKDIVESNALNKLTEEESGTPTDLPKYGHSAARM